MSKNVEIAEHLQVPEHRGGPNLRWSGTHWQRMYYDGPALLYTDMVGSAEEILQNYVDDWPIGTSHDSAHAEWLKRARELLRNKM